MATDEPSRSSVAGVDAALQLWRQGDCVLGEHWFVYRVSKTLQLTKAASATVDAGNDLVEFEVRGFAVLTQTCDVVRNCEERPFVEVSPLVEVEPARIHDVHRGRLPRYGYLPALASQHLVVDLDRVMTVEKALLATWNRLPGWSTDSEGRAFGAALARKRVRFAFPDDFVELAASLQKRLIEKHGKESDEGRALRALREIRVTAAPSWDAPEVELFIWFIRNENDELVGGKRWDVFLTSWLARLKPLGRFVSIDGQLTTRMDMTAADYVESDPLDLDHLSRSTS